MRIKRKGCLRMSNNYTPQQVAQFISEYVTNEDVKKELKKYGYNIVPNSLTKLIGNIEKIGYKVLKNDEYLDLKEQATKPAPTPEEPFPSEIQILGGVQVEPEQVQQKELVDPFSDVPLIRSLDTPVAEKKEEFPPPLQGSNSPSVEEKPKVKEFTHTIPPKEEPTEPMQKMWFKLKEKVKEVHSISLYSLVVNAQVVSLREDNTLVIGFSTKHTYQMNQFKRKDNLSKFEEIVQELTGKNYSLVCEVLNETKEATKQQAKPNKSNEIQILGGMTAEGGRV